MRSVLAALLLAAVCAHAGGGPQNVVVLVNDTSADSEEVGRYYAEKRHIPARNVVHLRCPTDPTVDLATFQATIERPLRKALRERGLVDHVDYLVLCQGMPLRVNAGGEAGGILAICAEMHLLDTPLATEPQEQLPSHANPYKGRDSFRHADEYSGWHLYLVTQLAAYTVADVKKMIDSSVASDGTAPQGDFWFQDADANASGRNVEYDPAIASLTAKKFHAEHVKSGAAVLVDKKDVMGYMSGGCYSQLTREGIHKNAYRPGSIVDMLESFGAVPENFNAASGGSQFPVTFFLDAGVAGIHGAVAEPYAHTFPSARLFERYTEGYNLAEAYYGTLPFVHWMNLVDGDPLCAPYAVRPEVKVKAPGAAASGTVQVHAEAILMAPPQATAASLELYVDGVRVASAQGAEADLAWDTTKFENGPHELLVAAIEAGPVATQGTAFASASVDNPALRVISTVPAADATNVSLSGPFEVRLNRAVAKAEGVTLTDDSGAALSAKLSVSEDGKVVTLEPAAPLKGGKRYKGAVAAGWKPAQGEPLPKAVSWAFTTTAKTLALAAPPQVPAGEPFELKITPQDDDGKAISPYAGLVNLTSTDPAAQTLRIGVAFAAQTPLTVPCTLKTLGRTTIAAVDPESGARGEVAVEVAPGPVKSLVILLPPGGVPRGTPVPIAVAAMDGAGNPVPTYTGKVELASDGNAVPMPPAHEYATSERGRHTFARVVFPATGEVTLSAKDASGATGTIKVTVADSGIRAWLWAGPFSGSAKTPSIDPDPTGGEAKLAPVPGQQMKGKRWVPLLSEADIADLTSHMQKDLGAVYAVVHIESPGDREAQIWFGSENVARLFWNGAIVHKNDKKRNHAPFEDHIAKVKVAKGSNTLVVKLFFDGAGVRFSAKVCDAEGKPLGDVTYATAAPTAPARATIAGWVRVKGQPVPNVTVALSGPEKFSATTGADGRFVFPGLAAGAYTLKPSAQKVTFDPESLKVDLAAEDALDAVFGLSDAVLPTVKVVSPKASAKIAGMTLFAAEVSDNVGIRSVRFLVDGEAVVPPIAREPFQASIDANSIAPGSHQLVVEVEDLSGNRTATKPQPITVVVDKTPPAVQISSPRSGDTVRQKIDLLARVGDDVAVASVQWYIDNQAFGGPVTAAPWTVPWAPDTKALKGKHVVKAVAKDTAGNTGEAQVQIEVK